MNCGVVSAGARLCGAGCAYRLAGGGGGGAAEPASELCGYCSPFDAIEVGALKPASVVAPQFEQKRCPGATGVPH